MTNRSEHVQRYLTFRKSKEDACTDFWHVVRWGLLIFVILLFTLPHVMPILLRDVTP